MIRPFWKYRWLNNNIKENLIINMSKKEKHNLSILIRILFIYQNRKKNYNFNFGCFKCSLDGLKKLAEQIFFFLFYKQTLKKCYFKTRTNKILLLVASTTTSKNSCRSYFFFVHFSIFWKRIHEICPNYAKYSRNGQNLHFCSKMVKILCICIWKYILHEIRSLVISIR